MKEVLLAERRQNSQITIIATSQSKASLHRVLVTPSGHHLFQRCIIIKPQDQVH